MIHSSIRYFGVLLGVYPTVLGVVYGAIQLGDETGFEAASPALHAKLLSLGNGLLSFIIEHWLFYIICCAGLAYIYALLVGAPKQTAKQNFEVARQKSTAKSEIEDGHG